MLSLQITSFKIFSHGQWMGEVTLPEHQFVTKILIYEWRDQLRAIDRSCPHKDYDLIGCPVSAGGIVICPWHGLPVSITDPKTSYLVTMQDEAYYLHYDPPTQTSKREHSE